MQYLVERERARKEINFTVIGKLDCQHYGSCQKVWRPCYMFCTSFYIRVTCPKSSEVITFWQEPEWNKGVPAVSSSLVIPHFLLKNDLFDKRQWNSEKGRNWGIVKPLTQKPFFHLWSWFWIVDQPKPNRTDNRCLTSYQLK